jgi:GT2 family glycosyltransferase
MSTIPTIFNERKVPHTIVGGTVKKTDEEQSPFTVILLNRGGRYYRSAVFQNLESAGFRSVISIEMSTEPYDIENLSIRFPAVKFLVPLEKASIGEMINTGMAETVSPLVLVLWNDIKITQGSIPQRLMARLSSDPVFCTAPLLTGSKLDPMPVQMIPAFNKKLFQVEPMPCYRDSSATIYPFDFVGIYNREKFIRLGGFDHTITNPYWQNLDLGFRARLWGEKILVSASFRLNYDGETPREDITADSSYIKFYLKNLAPVFRKDEAFIPIVRLFGFISSSGMNLFDAVHYFSSARKWVRLNRFRFTSDAATVTAEWEPETPIGPHVSGDAEAR